MAPVAEKEKDKSKVHKLSLKGSAKLVSEFVCLPGRRDENTSDDS